MIRILKLTLPASITFLSFLTSIVSGCDNHQANARRYSKTVTIKNNSLKNNELTNKVFDSISNDSILSYSVDPKSQDVRMYWKDKNGNLIKNFRNLRALVENQQTVLLFAMNGGMYKEDNTPLGLFIQNQNTVQPLNTSSGKGNFYLKPNGIFFLTFDGEAVVCNSNLFQANNKIRYATQSGPMLVVEGKIHPAFQKGSKNLNIRNGVGILPNGHVLFALSKREINFYDFANYFKRVGCKNALYLDGFISRAYLPKQNWIQLDGDFGVMIGVIKKR